MKNLGKTLLVLTISLFSMSSFTQSELTGHWTFGEQNTVVNLEQHNRVYSGKIISSDSPKVKIGTVLVKELKQTKGSWKGKVYSPKRKDWYDAVFKTKKDKLKIEISVSRFYKKTIEWTRVNKSIQK